MVSSSRLPLAVAALTPCSSSRSVRTPSNRRASAANVAEGIIILQSSKNGNRGCSLRGSVHVTFKKEDAGYIVASVK